MDAGLHGVEFEALGRIASTVGKNQGKALEKPENRGNPAFSSRIVKFSDFPRPKSDRLLVRGIGNKADPDQPALRCQRHHLCHFFVMYVTIRPDMQFRLRLSGGLASEA